MRVATHPWHMSEPFSIFLPTMKQCEQRVVVSSHFMTHDDVVAHAVRCAMRCARCDMVCGGVKREYRGKRGEKNTTGKEW